MCDYNEYSIVAAEYCVFVPYPRLDEDQYKKLLSERHSVQFIVLSFQAQQTSWEIYYTVLPNSYNYKFDHHFGLKNINVFVDQSEANGSLAEIVVWRWNDYKQEIVKRQLFYKKQNEQRFSYESELHLTIRLIEKHKSAKDVCPPLDYLDSDTFTISVGEQSFVVSAHRLMQVSPVFRAMLTDDTREKAERKVEVEEAEPKQFRAFLEVIDPDQDIRPNPTTVVGVLKLADRYQAKLAKNRCEEHLINCVELSFFDRLQLAGTYGLNKLKNTLLSIGTEKLRAFYKANSDELQKEGQFSKELLGELILRLC